MPKLFITYFIICGFKSKINKSKPSMSLFVNTFPRQARLYTSFSSHLFEDLAFGPLTTPTLTAVVEDLKGSLMQIRPDWNDFAKHGLGRNQVAVFG